MDLNEILKKQSKAKSKPISNKASDDKGYAEQLDDYFTSDIINIDIKKDKVKEKILTQNKNDKKDSEQIQPNVARPNKKKEIKIKPTYNEERNTNNDELDRDYNELLYLMASQKKVLMENLIRKCISNGGNTTGKVRTAILSKETAFAQTTIKTYLTRLKDDNLVSVKYAKRGAGGFLELQLPQKLIDTYITHKLDEPSNSIGLISTLSEKTPIESNNNDEWREVNISPLASIKFGQGHLTDIKKKSGLTPEVVQDCIDRFAWQLENDKFKGNEPLNTFVGKLCKGDEWNLVDGYKSKKEIALESFLAREKLRKEKEDRIIEDIVNTRFFNWAEKLSDEEKEKISPHVSNIPHKIQSRTQEANLKNYFKKNKLPEILKEEGVDI